MGRAPCCDKENVKRGPWSPEEDSKLKAYIDQYGTGNNWIALPQKIGIYNSLSLMRKDSQPRHVSSLNQNPKDATGVVDTLSNSALERLQLHMQLQSLQNPFSFYNHPSLWPKLHPIGERTLQSPTALMQEAPNTETGHYENVAFDELPASDKLGQASSSSSDRKRDESEILLNGFELLDSSTAFNSESNPLDRATISKSDGIELSNMEFQTFSGIQSELNNLFFSKTHGIVRREDQITGFECFREVDGSKDNMIWWSNEFDTKSSSSNSWDSASLLQPEGMFQDYVLGFEALEELQVQGGTVMSDDNSSQ
ncbi:hypothetical protein HHK36_026032 [Tetracentron sinense]|uniref:Uncharacterized protein n=1 Tax=Tetracentron sinense TaxID=13715 RepID=A0A835D3Q3_TETSI|nr:hypothetical protein HHK36_026032 [Tetracentron sinense]